MIVTVNEGDTLYSLSKEYNVNTKKIKADNGLSDDLLLVGQSLVIDVPQRLYVTQNNDLAQDVALSFDVSLRELYQNNFFLGGRENVASGDEVVISYKEVPSVGKIIGGYAYDFINIDRLYSVVNYLTYIMPFTYGFTNEGKLVVPNDDYIIRTAKDNGTRVLMHISTLGENDNFDSALFGRVYKNEAARQNLLDNIISQVLNNDYDGVDVDFEYLPAEQKQNYVDFTRELSQRLHALSKILVIAFPPKTSDDQEGLLYEGIDYRGLGENADYVLVMAYEYGYRFGPPMAVAPVNQIRRVLDYTVTRVANEKILLGMSNYGYDWTLPYVRGESDAPSLSPVGAVELAKKHGAEIMFDEMAQAPYFYYTDSQNREHIVYFEDAKSYEAKINLILEYNLAGGFIWEVMRENPSGYVTINSLVVIE